MDWDKMAQALQEAAAQLEPVQSTPQDPQAQSAAWIALTAKDAAVWKKRIGAALKRARTFELHCWREEEAQIVRALRYGQVKRQTQWPYGVIVTGPVTPAFSSMIVETKAEDPDHLTPFFGIFLDRHFSSGHYGLEIWDCGPDVPPVKPDDSTT